MRFRIKIGTDPSLQECTLPVEDLTTDLSRESGILVRNNGKCNVTLHRLSVIAVLTVERVPARILTIAQRIEGTIPQKAEATRRIVNEAKQGMPCNPSGCMGKPQRSKTNAIHACGAESPPKRAESHLPNGAWKRSPSRVEPTVNWYGGTMPIDETNIWFTRHIDTVGPDSDTEKESELPQIGTVATKGSAARVNVEYYLRRAVRRHGKDYLKAALMLADIYQQPGMPETMKK